MRLRPPPPPRAHSTLAHPPPPPATLSESVCSRDTPPVGPWASRHNHTPTDHRPHTHVTKDLDLDGPSAPAECGSTRPIIATHLFKAPP
eukprot:scaffold19754_cov137-Isochrysis_galbana.AAC.3